MDTLLTLITLCLFVILVLAVVLSLAMAFTQLMRSAVLGTWVITLWVLAIIEGAIFLLLIGIGVVYTGVVVFIILVVLVGILGLADKL